MRQNIIETIVGFFIIATAAFFLAFAYKTAGTSNNDEGYTLKAKFQSAEGIIEGSDIMLAGIKIGTVQKLRLDHESFLAVMEMNIDKDIKIPKDSQAAIVSSGFLGGKFVSISPGGDNDDLQNQDQIKFTQSSVNMEALIGKFMYSYSSNSNTNSGGGSGSGNIGINNTNNK